MNETRKRERDKQIDRGGFCVYCLYRVKEERDSETNIIE